MNKVGFNPLIGAPCEGLTLSIIAKKFSMVMIGDDKEVLYLCYLSHNRKTFQSMFLTFISNDNYIDEFKKKKFESAIISSNININKLPEKRTYLITKIDPLDAFILIHLFVYENNLYNKVQNYIGLESNISKSATIKSNVSIGNHCEIDDNVVIYPNTILGDNVKIKANSVLGGNGFEVKIVDGKKKVVPHWGGTYLGDYVEIGSMTTIDRSLQHAFTYIGNETKLSNQVQIAHGAQMGEKCTIAGHAQIANAEIGDSIVVGAAACCKSKIRIGNFAFVGMGSVVMNDVPDYAMVFGNPARRFSWVCICRDSINFDDNNFGQCQKCGQKYIKIDHIIKTIDKE